MKVTIDRGGCIGCGLCANACPEVFRIAEDGLAEIYAEPAEDTWQSVSEAAGSCPVEVITAEKS